MEPFDMLFDTGSNWLWVFSDECWNCPYVKSFDEEESLTYKRHNEQLTSLVYGSGSVDGYEADDTVCITKDYCSKDFRLMTITK